MNWVKVLELAREQSADERPPRPKRPYGWRARFNKPFEAQDTHSWVGFSSKVVDTTVKAGGL